MIMGITRITQSRRLAFWVVHGLALVAFDEFEGRDAGVEDIAVDSEVFCAVACNSFKESGATATRTTEYEDHFARLGKAGEALEEGFRAWHEGIP